MFHVSAESATLADSRLENTELIRIAGDECDRRLRRILRRRSLPYVDAKAEIVALASLIDDRGDYHFCPQAIRKEIYYWAARLHAGDAKSRHKAEEYKAKLVQLDRDGSCPRTWCKSGGGSRSPAGLAGMVRLPPRRAT